MNLAQMRTIVRRVSRDLKDAYPPDTLERMGDVWTNPNITESEGRVLDNLTEVSFPVGPQYIATHLLRQDGTIAYSYSERR